MMIENLKIWLAEKGLGDSKSVHEKSYLAWLMCRSNYTIQSKVPQVTSTVLNNENIYTTNFAHIDYGNSTVRTDVYCIITLKTLSKVGVPDISEFWREISDSTRASCYMHHRCL